MLSERVPQGVSAGLSWAQLGGSAEASAMGPGGSCTARPDSNSERRGGVEASGLPWTEVAF